MKEQFKAILAAGDFKQLQAYAKPAIWKKLKPDERELLALLFVKQGEQLLQKEKEGASESFSQALLIAPKNPTILFHQALVYAAQGQRSQHLYEAAQALEKAVELDPSFNNAWHSWGNVLVRLGLLHDQITFFYQADQKFRQAQAVHPPRTDESLSTLLWHWGVCWYHIGISSGEASDFSNALEKFRQAASCGCNVGAFYNDYGNVLVDFGCLMARPELLLEAIENYKKFTSQTPNADEGWLNLACTYQKLYDATGSQDYFEESKIAFEHALRLKPDSALAWQSCGELYASAGKSRHDLDLLSKSFEKFQKAHQLDPENPQLLLHWGGAQVMMASHIEDLPMLREAEKKIDLAMKDLQHDPDAWYVSGVCCSELGHYFNAQEYYEKALERFKTGIKLKDSHLLLLHSLALTYFTLGEFKDNIELIEQAMSYFKKAATINNKPFPQLLSDWGVALMKLGELTGERLYIEEAAEKFEKAIQQRLEVASSDDIELEWLYNYGCAMDFLGDFHEDPTYYEKAIKVLSHLLRIEPQHVHARYHLALAFLHLGELNDEPDNFYKAADLFHDIVEQDGEDEMAWNDYGLTLLNIAVLKNDPIHGDSAADLFQQAESKFHHAIGLGNVHAYYNLACLHALNNNPFAAIHHMERAEQCNALPPLADLMHDEWLEGMQDLPVFRQFISRIIEKHKGDPF